MPPRRRVQHWKHGWIPVSPEAKAYAEGRGPKPLSLRTSNPALPKTFTDAPNERVGLPVGRFKDDQAGGVSRAKAISEVLPYGVPPPVPKLQFASQDMPTRHTGGVAFSRNGTRALADALERRAEGTSDAFAVARATGRPVNPTGHRTLQEQARRDGKRIKDALGMKYTPLPDTEQGADGRVRYTGGIVLDRATADDMAAKLNQRFTGTTTNTQALRAAGLADPAGVVPETGGSSIIANRVAADLLARYQAVEPTITPQLVKTAAANGGFMMGLENRLKTQESLARKLDTKSKAKGLSVEQYGTKIADALRYTMIAPENNYGKATQDTIDSFRRQGYTVEVENTWKPGSTYKGINTNLSRDGLTFELQFHTEESMRVKTAQHGLYEIERDPTKTPEERAAATAQMRANSDAMLSPVGAESVR